MKRYFVKHGEINVHITEWGHEQSPVIFCLHGLGSTSFSFIEVAEKLKEEYRIIAFDAPGHGKTPPFKTEEEFELPQMAVWLNDLLTVLNIEKFYLLSHSWGSLVSLFYLAKYPNRVYGTILIDGGYQGKRHMEQTMEEEVASYETGFEEYVTTWDEFMDVVEGDWIRKTPYAEVYAKDLVLEKDGKFFWHARGKTAAAIIKAMHKDEAEDLYEELPPAILLLRATLPISWDEYRTKTAKIFEEKALGVIKLIPESTHMIHWDHPEAVVEEIRKSWSMKKVTI